MDNDDNLLPIGTVLRHRYEIVEVIGKGGFGYTYKAIDRDFPGKPVRVVKHLCPTHRDANSLKKARMLFKEEAKCLSILGENDGIPRLYAYFEEEGEFYLVEELIEGQDLTSEFEPGKKWSEEATIALLTELLSILSIVHESNRIHRDIKPANIMRREEDGKLVLIDFGAVREAVTADSDGQTTAIGIGTPPYMPAEQAMGRPGKYSDIYAVSIIGILALTGLTARDLLTNSAGLQDIWQNSNVEVSSKLKSVLERMIDFQPTRRFPDAASALEAIAPEIPPTVSSQFKKKALLALLATLGLLGIGTATQAYLARPNYTQLETYLQNQEWQLADEETDKIILAIANEQSELDTESIQKFSCKALEKIDRLWTENSNGKFGFTPQKQAYLATGNEFNNPAESMYKSFGDRVGWRTNIFGGDFWNLYGDLKFNNIAPEGHLPSPGKKKSDEKQLRVNEREMLLSRFNECKL